MKGTKNKLKHNNFRYASKIAINDPLSYLDDFYRLETNISDWLDIIHQMIHASVFPSMVNLEKLEFGYNYCKLIEQMEVAFVIYTQCGLLPHQDPLHMLIKPHQANSEVLVGIDPSEVLSRFFGFQSISKWYVSVDDLFIHFSTIKDLQNDGFSFHVLPIRELLLLLAKALYKIYREGGLEKQVPSYFIAIHQNSFQI